MNEALTPNKMLKMSLAEVEATLTKYLAIAEASNWDITDAFEQDLRALTTLAKAKGSTKRW
jgi:hypothetical protein